jgi:hypothetical protein
MARLRRLPWLSRLPRLSWLPRLRLWWLRRMLWLLHFLGRLPSVLIRHNPRSFDQRF